MDLQRILRKDWSCFWSLWGGCDYEDRETILRVIHKYLPDYDMSRSDNGPSLAYSLTETVYPAGQLLQVSAQPARRV